MSRSNPLTTCGSACAQASPCPTSPRQQRRKKPLGTPRAANTSSAVLSARARSCFTLSKNSKNAACRPRSRCCRWSNRPTTRAQSHPRRRPACGSSSPPPAKNTSSRKTGGATSGATSSPRPAPRSTTCRCCMACSTTGTWRSPPTTGARALWAVRLPRRAPMASRPITPACACRPKPQATSPNCRRSKTS